MFYILKNLLVRSVPPEHHQDCCLPVLCVDHLLGLLATRNDWINFIQRSNRCAWSLFRPGLTFC